MLLRDESGTGRSNRNFIYPVIFLLKICPAFSKIKTADCRSRPAKQGIFKGDVEMEFMLLAGGFLIIIFAVVVSVVSSVVSAVAADQDVED